MKFPKEDRPWANPNLVAERNEQKENEEAPTGGALISKVRRLRVPREGKEPVRYITTHVTAVLWGVHLTPGPGGSIHTGDLMNVHSSPQISSRNQWSAFVEGIRVRLAPGGTLSPSQTVQETLMKRRPPTPRPTAHARPVWTGLRKPERDVPALGDHPARTGTLPEPASTGVAEPREAAAVVGEPPSPRAVQLWIDAAAGGQGMNVLSFPLPFKFPLGVFRLLGGSLSDAVKVGQASWGKEGWVDWAAGGGRTHRTETAQRYVLGCTVTSLDEQQPAFY